MRGISSLDVMEFDQYGAARAARQGAPLLAIIACDKRKAFAQGSVSDEAIQLASLTLDCFAGARNEGEAPLLAVRTVGC
jgi:hypothetical protein